MRITDKSIVMLQLRAEKLCHNMSDAVMPSFIYGSKSLTYIDQKISVENAQYMKQIF